MQRWPWITLVVIAAISPPGWEFIRSAFFSSEQLSRNIVQPLIYMGLTIAAVLALVETGIQYLIYRAR